MSARQAGFLSRLLSSRPAGDRQKQENKSIMIYLKGIVKRVVGLYLEKKKGKSLYTWDKLFY